MKTLMFLSSLVSLSLAFEVIDVKRLDIKNLKFDLDKDFVDNFLVRYREGKETDLTAIVNEFADKIFKNIEVLAVENNMDPLDINDVKEKYSAATIELTNGHLSGIATIERADDVTLSYNSDSKIMEVFVPFIFSNLVFDYKYHAKVVLIGVSGNMVGTINNLEMKVRLDFDFNTYHAEVKEVETKEDGNVKLKFSGNGVVDAIVNVLTKFVVNILHPKINSKIHQIIENIAERVVTAVNEAVDAFFNQPTTASIMKKYIL